MTTTTTKIKNEDIIHLDTDSNLGIDLSSYDINNEGKSEIKENNNDNEEMQIATPNHLSFFKTRCRTIACRHCCETFNTLPKSLPTDVWRIPYHKLYFNSETDQLTDTKTSKYCQRICDVRKKYLSLKTEDEKQKWFNTPEGVKYGGFVCMRNKTIQNKILRISTLMANKHKGSSLNSLSNSCMPPLTIDDYDPFNMHYMHSNLHQYRWKFRGVYCSWPCVVAYALENTLMNTHEVMGWIKLAAKVLDGIPMIYTINPSPPIDVLKKFGGLYTIDEYRLKFCTIQLTKDPVLNGVIQYQMSNMKLFVVPNETHITKIPTLRALKRMPKLPTRLQTDQLPEKVAILGKPTVTVTATPQTSSLSGRKIRSKRIETVNDTYDIDININKIHAGEQSGIESKLNTVPNGTKILKRKFGIEIINTTSSSKMPHLKQQQQQQIKSSVKNEEMENSLKKVKIEK